MIGCDCVCPKCGSLKLWLMVGEEPRKYRCFRCGHVFISDAEPDCSNLTSTVKILTSSEAQDIGEE